MSEPVVTTPHGEVGIALPVRTLRVDVIEGPDAGAAHASAGEALTIGTARGNDLVLTDDTVSRYHVELSRGRGGVRVVDCGSTNGTYAGGVGLETGTVAAGTVLQLGKTRLRVGDGERRMLELHAGDALAGLRGRSPAMRRLMVSLERAAASDVSVLVIGESGTGKELVARGLHDLGRRAAGPFVAVDCAALSPALVASELFGHERGAFRLDLYYRLAVVTLALPPLRERPEDLELLVSHFLREAGHAGPLDAVFPPATMRALATHRWPGNVRELRNLVEAALAMGEPPPLDAAPPPGADPIERVLALGYRDARQRLLHEFEARYLAALFERADRNVSRAAREAGMDRSHLLELLQRHKLR